jgi:hypothetical protein
MSVGRTIYCDGPGCAPCHVYTDTPAPHLPGGFVAVREQGNAGGGIVHHFCGWGCLMKYAAKFPPEGRIDMGRPDNE